MGRPRVSGLLVSREGGVLRLTIDRPERMNALDGPTALALADALTKDAVQPDVRVVVIAGTGGAFCTGADVLAIASAEPPANQAEADARAQQTMDTANRLVRAIIELPLPVVAAVNGPAAGLGVSLALACDLVYAAEEAYFLLAFANVGLMPDGGASLLVPAALGRARANAMALLAEPMTAEHACATGLINEVLPAAELAERVDKVARRLARGPRRALELTKRALTASTLALLEDALERESVGQRELLGSPDFAEGIAAVLEHRRTRFA
ncbi:enoyl-CoA hydratase [Rhodococcus sp. X156]|uniref:enoyl-CoA hydratase n=1 Tax=Rhodococcus sp. X156 TaxID=2499145 RepID=UPI0019D11F57|nr:enoyl-CoA hydratase [Rhodococcus sp. X156]